MTANDELWPANEQGAAMRFGDMNKSDASKRPFRDILRTIVAETGRAPIFILDKDGTLTPPRQPLNSATAEAVFAILSSGAVLAVISGAEAYRLKDEVFAPLTSQLHPTSPLNNLYLIAENGAQMYQANGAYLDLVYRLDLRDALGAERFAKLLTIVEETRLKFGIGDDPLKRHVVSDGSHIKLSGLGNVVDEEARRRYDPDGTQRALWAKHVRVRMQEEGVSDGERPVVDVIVSGTSSINLLASGVNKGSAIARLTARCGLDASSVVYFGDKFGAVGNDVYALAHARVAVNFGHDVPVGPTAAPVLSAEEKGPDGALTYLRLARRVLMDAGATL